MDSSHNTMKKGSEHSTGRRSSELRSPSYFRNVVPLGPDCMSPLPETSPSNATKKVTTPISIPALPSEKSSKGKILVDNLHLRLPEISSNKISKNSEHDGLIPAASPPNSYNPNNMLQGQRTTPIATNVCSRRIGGATSTNQRKQHRRRRRRKVDHNTDNVNRCCFGFSCGGLCWCCNDRKIVRSTLSCMNVVAKILSWCTVVASVAGVVWYSYELKKTG